MSQMSQDASRDLRASLARRIADALGRDGARIVGPSSVAFSIDGADLRVDVLAADARGVFARRADYALAYSLTDTREGVVVRARALLLRVLESLAPSAEASPRTRRASREHALARHRETIGAWPRHAAATPDALPACLDTSMRPPAPPQERLPASPPRDAPCSGCAVGPWCAFVPLGPEDAAVQPLLHADDAHAARVATAEIVAAFGSHVPPEVDDFFALAAELHREVPRALRVPFEFSLKARADALVPCIRIVAYAPARRRDVDSERGARQDRHQRIAAFWRAKVGAAALAPFAGVFDAASRGCPDGLELSVGLEASLDPARAPLHQLYVHADPSDRVGSTALAHAALSHPAVEPRLVEALLAHVAPSDVQAETRLTPTLVALSPTPDDPSRRKLYFAVARDAELPDVGLRPPELAGLAPFAPATGLAVLEIGAEGARFRKFDFPCLAHFQESGPVVAAFVATLDPRDRERGTAILANARFRAWPTWLSVESGGAAFYFLPR